METIFLQLLTAMAGSFGFCLLFHLQRRLLIPASLGGLLCWGAYLAGTALWEGIFFPTLVSSAFAALYAELLAWLMRAPATLFFVPAVIPLVPGSSLYYAMYNAVASQWDMARSYGSRTALFAFGIAVGACLVWALFEMKRSFHTMLAQRKQGSGKRM